MNSIEIKKALDRNGIPCQDDLPEKLQIYLSLLMQWNKQMDLTAVTDEAETVDKHFIDSLAVLNTGLITTQSSLIDVGTGAGFPGLVLAMALPDIHVTLMDSQQKRLTFLEYVINAAEVQNTTVIHARAEDGARNPDLREKFDFAVARALAPLNTLCEYLLPYVKPGGYAICWKGPALSDEIGSGRKAAHLLGGRIEMPRRCMIADRDWEHMILPIRKTEPTSSVYPRKAGIPKSRPLGI